MRIVPSILSVSLSVALFAGAALAQTPPKNPYLADSTWPIFHQSTYAQASGPFAAPKEGDPARVQRLDKPSSGTSPWTVLAAPYRDGSQAAFGSVQTGVVKWLLDGDAFEQVSYLPLPRGRLDFDWNIFVLRTGEVVVTSKRENAFYVLADTRPDCPRCPLAVTRRINVPRGVGDLSTHFSLSYDGHLLALTENGKLIAASLRTGAVVDAYDFGLAGSDYGQHNAFAVDETGRVFVTTQESITAPDWNGQRFTLGWRAAYDFRGPGCRPERRTGRLREIMRVERG